MKTWLRLGALLAVGLTIALPGCANESEEDEPDTDEAEVTAAGGAFGPALFRNDFYTYLKNAGFQEDQIRQLVLMPTDEAIAPKVTVDPANPLAAHDRAFRSIKPSDLYEKGLREPLVKKKWPLSDDLEGELRRRPIHIVVVPGIFGEFIPVSPFEEAFRTGGVAKLDFEKKIDDLDRDPAKREKTRDKQWSSAQLKDVDRSLKETLRVASIDDADGHPMVTITYLKPELGSLETFGTLDENANYYLPRLQKYFDVMGVPEHLYVMGYSRGMATALNLVSRADKEHAAWLPKLKGVIGLAGVVYGSQLADAAMSPGVQFDMLNTMQDFIETKLESCTEPTPSAWLMTKNAGHWTAFAGRMALIAPKMGNQNVKLENEGIDTAFADVGSFVSFTKRALFGAPEDVFDTDGSDNAVYGVLNLSAPNAEYCQNIERFKKTATQIIKGVQTLTTQSRIDWWHTHTLPTHVRYYAITGTMGNATPEHQQPHLLVKTPVSNDPRSVDFRSLRGNYYDLLAASGTELQDSQVPVQRGRFWDDVDRALNPGQAPMKTYFMGTVGIHHWGLSFPRAFATRDGLEANPFPRTILLKSIATFVAQVERRGG